MAGEPDLGARDPTEGQQPNVLLIVWDSARADVFGCYGHPVVQTPHVDRLAAAGVRFLQAFTASPLCHPARASLDTGLFPHQNGMLNNSVPGEYPFRIHSGLASYVSLLAQMGYRTGYVGQRHLRPELFHDVIPGSYTALRAAGLRETVRSDRPHGTYYGCLELPMEQHRDYFTVRGTLELLRRYAALPQPWLIQCEFDGPHPPFRVPVPFVDLYDPGQVPKPANFDDPALEKPPIHRRVRRQQLDRPFDRTWQELIAHYWAYVSLLDHFTGQILDELDRLDLSSRTLVLLTSDHGELVGAHAAVTKYPCMYEEVVRVPLIARWPAHLPAGHTVEGLVSHVDLLPSLVELAASPPGSTSTLPVPSGLAGQSWAKLARGEAGALDRQAVYAELHGFGTNWYALRMVRTPEWKLVYSPYEEPELYDLHNDPGELHNLARSHPQQLRHLVDLLRAHTVATGDRLALYPP